MTTTTAVDMKTVLKVDQARNDRTVMLPRHMQELHAERERLSAKRKALDDEIKTLTAHFEAALENAGTGMLSDGSGSYTFKESFVEGYVVKARKQRSLRFVPAVAS